MRYRLLFLILGLVAFILTGCAKQVVNKNDPLAVAPGKVAEFQKSPQDKVDVYVPLRDQYASSKHAMALEDLNNYNDKSRIQDHCYNCHSAEYRLAPANAKPNVNQLSTTITCIVCHELTVSDYRLRTTPLDTCTQCHWAGAEIKPGSAVKHPQKEMFSGKGALEVAEKPSTKYNAGLTCIECHMPNQSHTFESLTPARSLEKKVGSTCMMCHTKLSAKDFADKVAEVQQQTEDKITMLKADLDSLKTTMEAGRMAGRNMAEAQQLFDLAFTNVSFVEADGSKGVHNTEYARDTLDVAQKKIAEAKQLAGK